MTIQVFANYSSLVLINLIVFLQKDQDEKILENILLGCHIVLKAHYHILIVFFLYCELFFER